MPSTLSGLLLFLITLVPGFVYYVQRRRWVELKSESALVETARFVTVSVLTDLAALGLFVLARHFLPNHTPSPAAVASGGWKYFWPHSAWLVGWGVGLLALSSLLASLLALLSQTQLNIKWLAPDIVQTSAWQRWFKDEVDTKKAKQEKLIPYVGIDMKDGTYVGGYVAWFSTELDEVEDRDLVLAAPITVRRDGKEIEAGYSRLIVSARDIVRLYVSYLTKPEDGAPPPAGPANGAVKAIVGPVIVCLLVICAWRDRRKRR